MKYKHDTSSVCDEFQRLANGGMVDCWLPKGHEGPHNFDRTQRPPQLPEVESIRLQLSESRAELGRARESIKSAASAIIQARTLLKGMIESERVHPHECRNTFQKLGQWIMDQAALSKPEPAKGEQHGQ